MQQYQNPIIRGLNPDPSVICIGEDYYLATSTLHLFPGVPIYHSRDLINWRLISHALTRPQQFLADRTNGKINIYAPTIRYHDGVFYLITTNVAEGGGNYYVTTRDPAGEWSDPIFVEEGVFDPSLFFDDDGKVYYTRRGGFGLTESVQAEIDITTGKLIGVLRPVCHGFRSEDCEGPHLYKINDWYYMLQAEGGSRYLHMATIGRSKSPWGPFEGSPWNPVIGQLRNWGYPIRSAGHAELVRAHNGSWWLFFLATRHGEYDALTTIGRETFLLPVSWKDGWPTTEVTQLADLTVTAELPKAHPFAPVARRDEFESQILDFSRFVYIHYLSSQCVDLSSRPSWLRLRPLGNELSEHSPCAFIATRQTEYNFTAATKIDFSPRSSLNEAGLSIYQKSNFRYDLFITDDNGRRVLKLRKRIGDICQLEQLAVMPVSGPVRISVTGDMKHYRFSLADPTGKFHFLAEGLVNLISTDTAQSWGGVLIGMYVTSGHAANAPHADFDFFELNTKLTEGSTQND